MVLTVLLFGGTRLMAQNENNSVDPQTTPTEENLESKNEGEEGASSVDTDKNTNIDSNEANDDKETAKTETETPEANKTENTENAPKAKQKEKKTKAKEAEKPAETPDVKAAEKTAEGNGPEDGAKLEAAPAKAPEAVGEGNGEGTGTGKGNDPKKPAEPTPGTKIIQFDPSSDEDLQKIQKQIDDEKDKNKKAELRKMYNEKYLQKLEDAGKDKTDEETAKRLKEKDIAKYNAIKAKHEELNKKLSEGKLTQKDIDELNELLGDFNPPRALTDDEKNALDVLHKNPEIPSLPNDTDNQYKNLYTAYEKAKKDLNDAINGTTPINPQELKKLEKAFQDAEEKLLKEIRAGNVTPNYTDPNNNPSVKVHLMDGAKKGQELNKDIYHIPDNTDLNLLVEIRKNNEADKNNKKLTFTIVPEGDKGVRLSESQIKNLVFLNETNIELTRNPDGTYQFNIDKGFNTEKNFGIAQLRFNMPGFSAAYNKGFKLIMKATNGEDGSKVEKEITKTFLITKQGYEDDADVSGIGSDKKEYAPTINAGETENGNVKDDTDKAFDFFAFLKKSNAYIDDVLVNSANGESQPLSSVDIIITAPKYGERNFAEWIHRSGLEYHKLRNGKYQLKLDKKVFKSNLTKDNDGNLFYDNKKIQPKELTDVILENAGKRVYIDNYGNSHEITTREYLENDEQTFKVEGGKLYIKKDGADLEGIDFVNGKAIVKETNGEGKEVERIYELRGKDLISYTKAIDVYEGNVVNKKEGANEKADITVTPTYNGKQVTVGTGENKSYGGTVVGGNEGSYYKVNGKELKYIAKPEELTGYKVAYIDADGKRVEVTGSTDTSNLTKVDNKVFNKKGYIVEGIEFRDKYSLLDKYGRLMGDIKVNYDSTSRKYTFTSKGKKASDNISVGTSDEVILVDHKNYLVKDAEKNNYTQILGKYYYDGTKFVKAETKGDKTLDGLKIYENFVKTQLKDQIKKTYKITNADGSKNTVDFNDENKKVYQGSTAKDDYFTLGGKTYIRKTDELGEYYVNYDDGNDVLTEKERTKIVQTLGDKIVVTDETDIFNAIQNAKFALRFPGFLASNTLVYNLHAEFKAEYADPHGDKGISSVFKDKTKNVVTKDNSGNITEIKRVVDKYFKIGSRKKSEGNFFKNPPDELLKTPDYNFFNIFYRDSDDRSRDEFITEMLNMSVEDRVKKENKEKLDVFNKIKAELSRLYDGAEFVLNDKKDGFVIKRGDKEVTIERSLLWTVGFNNPDSVLFPENPDAKIVIEDHSMDNRLIYDEIIVNDTQDNWNKAKEDWEKKEENKGKEFAGTKQYFFLDSIDSIHFGVNPNFIKERFVPLGEPYKLTGKAIIEALKNLEVGKNETTVTVGNDTKGKVEYKIIRNPENGQVRIKVLNVFYKDNEVEPKDAKLNKFYSPVQKAYQEKLNTLLTKIDGLQTGEEQAATDAIESFVTAFYGKGSECHRILTKKLKEELQKVGNSTGNSITLDQFKSNLMEEIGKLSLIYLDKAKNDKGYKFDDMRFNAIRIELKAGTTIGSAIDPTKRKIIGITSVLNPKVDIPFTDEFGDLLKNKDKYVYEAIEAIKTDKNFGEPSVKDNDIKFTDEEGNEIWKNNEDSFRKVMIEAYRRANLNSSKFKDLVEIEIKNKDKLGFEKYTVKAGKDFYFIDLAIVGKDNEKDAIKNDIGANINPWFDNSGISIGSKFDANDPIRQKEEFKALENKRIDLAAYYMSTQGYARRTYVNKAAYKFDLEEQSPGITKESNTNKSKKCYPGIGVCIQEAGKSESDKTDGQEYDFGVDGETENKFQLTYTPSNTGVKTENPGINKDSNKASIDFSKEDEDRRVDFTISTTVDKLTFNDKKIADKLSDTDSKLIENDYAIDEKTKDRKYYLYKNSLIIDFLPKIFTIDDKTNLNLTINREALMYSGANAKKFKSKEEFDAWQKQIEIKVIEDLDSYLAKLKTSDPEKAKVLEKAIDGKDVKGKQAVLAWLPEFEAPHGSQNQFVFELKNLLVNQKEYKESKDRNNLGIWVKNEAKFGSKAFIYDYKELNVTDGHKGNVNKYLRIYDEKGNPVKDEEAGEWFKGSTTLKFGDKFDYMISAHYKNKIISDDDEFKFESEWEITDPFREYAFGVTPILRGFVEDTEEFKNMKEKDRFVILYKVGEEYFTKDKVTDLSKVSGIKITTKAFPDGSLQSFVLPMMIPEFDAEVKDGKVYYQAKDGDKKLIGDAKDFFDLNKLNKPGEENEIKAENIAENKLGKTNTVTVYLDKERFIKLKKIFEDSEGKELKENLPEVEFKLHAYRIKLDNDGKAVKDANGNLIKEKVNLKDLGIEKDTLKLNKANNFFDAIYHLPLFKKTVKTSEEKTTDDGTKAQIVVDGYMYEYELEEIPVKGYEFKGTKTYKLANGEDDPLGFVLEATNTEKPEYPGDHPHDNPKNVKVKITVNKVWKVLKGGETPSIQVELYANGEATGKIITLGADGSWSASFEDLPAKDKDGKDIVYTVVEVGETNHVTEIGERKFEVSYSIGEDGSITITNKEIPPEEPKDEKPKDKKEPKKHKPNDEEERDRTPKKNRIPKTGVNEDLGAIYFAFVLLLGLVFIKKRYLVK